MTAIPAPSVDAQAADINDSGVVVGTMKANGGLSNNHAWVYEDGVVTNLNTLVLPGSPTASEHVQLSERQIKAVHSSRSRRRRPLRKWGALFE
jgi:probable HAF family extracellular repeat protein